MTENSNLHRFFDLTFEDFKRLAKDDELSPIEKVGFPNSYREGKEELIFQDIIRKATNLKLSKQTVLEIGPGCSKPAFMMIDLCRQQEHQLLLADSMEMLNHLPNDNFLVKLPGRYPGDCASLFEKYEGKVDVIVTYSVLHYIFVESSIFDFIDHSMSLLSEGGQLLIGDIPNVSKRKRFFSAPEGVRFHQAYTGTVENPDVGFNTVETGKIDDAVILSILARCRASGFDAYVLPQPADLPMANRREDILIIRP
jgi:hypothetical protein